MKIYSNGKMIEAGGGSAQDIYSTEETRIGTWIDGKPLYRRVVQITSPNATDTYKYYNVPSPSPIETITKIDGVIHASSGFDSPVNCYRGDFWCSTQASTNQIVVRVYGSWLISRPMDIVIEYTKTTDQPTVSTAEILTAYLDGFSADDMEAPAAAAASSGTEIINQEEA